MTAHRVTETDLFRLLVAREAKDGFEASQVSSRVNLVVDEAWPLLQQVSRSFPLYTLHDPEHSFRVAQNMHRLIPDVTLSELNAVELSILIYSAYLHDVGMASSEAEFHKWLASAAFDEYVSSRDRWLTALRRVRHFADDTQAQDSESSDEPPTSVTMPTNVALRCLQDIIYTEYLRDTHAARSADYVTRRHGPTGTSTQRIQIGEVNYAREVALVCQSHWENPSALRAAHYRRDIYVGRFSTNLQYCAIILRLADLLELDPERTPATLLDFLLLDLSGTNSPETPTEVARTRSAEEWKKQRAILGYKISPDDIRIEARCSHPAIQKGLREWCEYIDSERRECRLVARENTEEITRRYRLDLSVDVRKDYIESDGSYIYTDFQLQLDYDRIVSLLMGTQLWGDPVVVVRELLQNALDACNHRAALCKRQGVPYTPQIVVGMSYQRDGEESVASLTCEDNGTGMSQELIEKYLIRIGSSYYQSSDFRRQNLDFTPISHFGLGLMSCFMLSDRLVVDTQHIDEQLRRQLPLRVELDSKGRYVVLRQLAAPREGTLVSIPLSHRSRHFLDDLDGPFDHRGKHRRFRGGRFGHGLFDTIYELAMHLDVPIEISYDGRHKEQIQPKPFELPNIDRTGFPAIRDRFREFVFTHSHDEGKGIAGAFRFLLPLDSGGNVSLGCTVESTFKLFLDDDGDLCLTTPGYETKDLQIDFGLSQDWDTDEVRGVYRFKFGHKPPASSGSYDSKVPSSLLEVIRGSFRWSQDGLLVGSLSHYDHEPHHSSSEETGSDEDISMNRLFKLVPVPGLNAVDMDLRDHARLALNVQRSDFQHDSSLDSFRQRYYALTAEMWHRILADADALPPNGTNLALLDALLQQANQQFRMQLETLIPQILDERYHRRGQHREFLGPDHADS